MKRPQPPAVGTPPGLLWYVLALVPIALVAYMGVTGSLPPIVVPFALFLTIFWLLSFAFALVNRMRKPKEPRQ